MERLQKVADLLLWCVFSEKWKPWRPLRRTGMNRCLRRINSVVYHDFIVKSGLCLVYHRTSWAFPIVFLSLVFPLGFLSGLKGRFAKNDHSSSFTHPQSFQHVWILQRNTVIFWEKSQWFFVHIMKVSGLLCCWFPTFFRISSFIFHGEKKVIQDWNNTRVSKWW